jgi:hypothetical protein
MLIELTRGTNNYTNQLFFLLFNGYGTPINLLGSSFLNLGTCELSRIVSLGTTQNYILIIGIVVLGCSFTFLSLYLLSIDRSLNTLWEYLRRRIHHGFYEVKQAISDRLAQYHYQNDAGETDFDSNSYKDSKRLSFRHSLRYLGRFSILFVFSVVFYIVCAFVFYSNIQNYLYNRPELLTTTLNRRVQLNVLAFTTLEHEYMGFNYSIPMIFPYFTNLMDPITYWTSAISEILNTNDFIRSPEARMLMYSDLYSLIFQYYSNSTILTLGTLVSVGYITQEAMYIMNDGTLNSFDTIDLFVSQLVQVSSAIQNTASLLNVDSQSIINDQLNKLIYFSVAGSSFVLFIYLFYYLPLLLSEIRILKKITDVLRILPTTPVSVLLGKSQRES